MLLVSVGQGSLVLSSTVYSVHAAQTQCKISICVQDWEMFQWFEPVLVQVVMAAMVPRRMLTQL